MNKTYNSLKHENSLYLRSHSKNPVNWFSWNEEILNKAKKEKIPIILSIGYSSCHWCHVMEKESFMDKEIAEIMNYHFINIKVDREERPDIDKIYMESIQTMGINGGWPLNIFLTPNQKPFYGGTYFDKKNWKNLLLSVSNAYKNNKKEIEKSATNFTKSLKKSEIDKYNLTKTNEKINKNYFDNIIENLKSKFDKVNGGLIGSPKFPMPSIWEFLINFLYFFNDKKIKNHLSLTLNKISKGGIYDQIEGGFCRYSVDEKWKIPHFEKMLYDNGQLLNLYSNFYKITNDNYYKRILYETTEWLKKNMIDPNGGFYSSIDADSEGEEGKYYKWKYDEFFKEAGKDYKMFGDYYGLNTNEDESTLNRKYDDSSFVKKWKIDKKEFFKKLDKLKFKLIKKRNKKEKPVIDKKIISSWNGLTLIGLLNTYEATNDDKFLKIAKNNISFIRKSLIKNNKLLHSYDTHIEGFFDDYSIIIKSFIKYHEVTQEIEYIKIAKKLMDISIQKFYSKKEKFFYYSSKNSNKLIAKKIEIFDNVIPSSNSIMAENLIKISKIFDESEYFKISENMLLNVIKICKQEHSFLSNWLNVLLNYRIGYNEIILTGKNTKDSIRKINLKYSNNKVILASEKKNNMKLLRGKLFTKKINMYFCKNKVCQLPVNSMSELNKLIEKNNILN